MQILTTHNRYLSEKIPAFQTDNEAEVNRSQIMVLATICMDIVRHRTSYLTDLSFKESLFKMSRWHAFIYLLSGPINQPVRQAVCKYFVNQK
jgi:hypothetical protein